MNTTVGSAPADLVAVSGPVPTHRAIDTKALMEKATIRNLNFFYGETRALNNINLMLYANKSTLLRVLNRMYDLYPKQRATGEVSFDGENILSPKQDRQSTALPHRHGVPEADALSHVDLREHRFWHPPLRALGAG